MRKGIIVTEALLIAVLTFLTAYIADNKSDGAVSKYILEYIDTNTTKPVEKAYPPIYTGVDFEKH